MESQQHPWQPSGCDNCIISDSPSSPGIGCIFFFSVVFKWLLFPYTAHVWRSFSFVLVTFHWEVSGLPHVMTGHCVHPLIICKSTLGTQVGELQTSNYSLLNLFTSITCWQMITQTTNFHCGRLEVPSMSGWASHELFSWCFPVERSETHCWQWAEKACAKVLLCAFSPSDGGVPVLLSHVPRNQTILRLLRECCKFTLAGGFGKHFRGE